MRMLIRSYIIAVLTAGSSVIAADEKTDTGWDARIAPYLWLTGIETKLKVPGDNGTAVLSFGDLWKIQEYGGSIYLEAQKDRLAIIGDGIYIQDEFPSTSSDPAAVADVEQLTGELSVAYRPFEGPAELTAGLLATSLKVDVAVEDGPSADLDDSWIDPLLGVRVRTRAGEKVSLMFRGDIAGFGINDARGIRLMIEADLYINERLYFLTAFRFAHLDYEPGGFNAEVTYNALALGLGYHF